jgi:hypothetical protein
MAHKLLAKLTTWLSCLSLSIVLVLSLLVPLTLIHPQPAHAATLPAYRYTKTFDTSAGGAYGSSVTTDAQGNVYVTGQFTGTVVFDGVGGSDSQTEANTSSFLTKYNANGSYAYTKTFDTSAGGAYAYGTSVATDAQGNVYVTGTFRNTVVFDGVGGSDSRTSSNNSSFLTSFQVFIPNKPSPAPVPVPGAPNTGFGGSVTHPIRLLTFYGLVSFSIAMLAIVSTKLIKRWSG